MLPSALWVPLLMCGTPLHNITKGIYQFHCQNMRAAEPDGELPDSGMLPSALWVSLLMCSTPLNNLTKGI